MMELAEMQMDESSQIAELNAPIPASDFPAREQPPRVPNGKVEALTRRAAAPLGIPEAQIVGLTKSHEHLAFRRACVAFLLCEAGLDRKDIAGAFHRSATWTDGSINAVKQRMESSAPFRASIEGVCEDLRLNSPVTAKFRSIRKVLASHHGLATSGDLTTAAALLTLADALVSTNEAEA
jgi:hypothetical protein